MSQTAGTPRGMETARDRPSPWFLVERAGVERYGCLKTHGAGQAPSKAARLSRVSKQALRETASATRSYRTPCRSVRYCRTPTDGDDVCSSSLATAPPSNTRRHRQLREVRDPNSEPTRAPASCSQSAANVSSELLMGGGFFEIWQGRCAAKHSDFTKSRLFSHRHPGSGACAASRLLPSTLCNAADFVKSEGATCTYGREMDEIRSFYRRAQNTHEEQTGHILRTICG